MASLLEAALEHARGGRPVFPVHYVVGKDECSCSKRHLCGSIGKHPMHSGWQAEATTDEAQVRAWWRAKPRSNIGMPTGARSGFSILDVDPLHGGEETLGELLRTHGKLPDTWESLTGGGGRHIWFRHQDGVKSNASKIGDGLDIRGEGGLIVLPGSHHLSGRKYSWELSSAPEMLPLAEWPPWLILEASATPNHTGKAKPGQAPNLVGRIASKSRNNTLASIAGTMRRRGLSGDEILPALLAINANRCDPPLDEDEVRTISDSIARYSPEQTRELRLIASHSRGILEEEVSLIPLRVSRGQPPIYTATVRGHELRLTSADLIQFSRFKMRCMESLDFIPDPPARFDKGKRLPASVAWEEIVNEALASVTEESEPPSEASPQGALWDGIVQFTEGCPVTEDRSGILNGNIVIEGDDYIFRSRDLRRHLLLNHVTTLSEHEVWIVLRDHGARSALLRVDARVVRTIRLPVAVVKELAEAPVTKETPESSYSPDFRTMLE